MYVNFYETFAVEIDESRLWFLTTFADGAEYFEG